MTDRHSFFFSLSSAYTREDFYQKKKSRRQTEEDAFRTKPSSRVILKVPSSSGARSNFVSPKSGVRCFRSQERSPPFLSSVVECDDEREKEVHTRARREKIRICAIVPLSAMISSSSSESTSIVAVIFCDESSIIGVRVLLFVSLFSSAEERFLRRPVSLFWSV